MKLVPLGDRVVLKQCVAEETTKSGIVIPGQSKEKPQQAEVIAVGPGVMLVKVIGLVHMSRITFMGHGGVEGAGICTLVINVNGIVFRPVNRYCKIESRA